MALDPRNPDDLDRVTALAARVRDEWRDDPNVVNVAPGLRVAKGYAVPGELILTFFVREKLDAAALEARGLRPIPREIEGVGTDVERSAQPRLASPLGPRRERRDPIMGGLAIGNGNIQWHFGTIGGVVFDEVTGAARGLTNEHVLVDYTEGQTGDPVQQPAPPNLEDYIDVEFSLDCCPVGPIFFLHTGGPISSFLTWLAVMAGIVALSDERDPTRRGQEATTPAPGERTLRERVDVALKYPDFPIPGTRHRVGVDWTYTRHTTGASYTHHVAETNTNEHVLTLQRLVTDRRQYWRGNVIHLLAMISSPARRPCDAYHAVALLVPGAEGQQGRSHSVILRPAGPQELVAIRRFFPDLDEQVDLRCDTYRDVQPGTALPNPFTHGGLVYEPLDAAYGLRANDAIPAGAPDGVSEIHFLRPFRVKLPAPTDAITATVAQFTNTPVKMEAFNAAGALVGQATAPAVQRTPHRLTVGGAGIVEARFSGGGGEGVLIEFCRGRRQEKPRCFYYGRVVVDPLDPIGPWRTYLFAQTINDVAVGTKPELAAPIIGGIPVTRNFEPRGPGEVHPYGKGCILQPFVDGDFEVLP